MQTCKKPIFPILPSINTAGAEVSAFLAKGHVNFADEVTLGTALSRIVNAPKPAVPEIELFGVDVPRIRRIIDSIPEDGYIAPNYVQALLHAAGIPLVDEFVSDNKEEIVAFARRCGFPVVAKVVGPVHKSDVGGVVLNIKSEQHLALEFDRMMQIPDARAIMVQPMLKGTELFVGAKYEEKFGHVVLCGLGGIFVEVLKDVSSGLAPLSYEEAYSMIHSLRAYKIIQGTRGQKGVNEDKFAEIIVRLSTLLRFATEIKEMEGFGQKSFDNLVSAIEKSKISPLENFINALGINQVGLANAKLLCRHFDNNINNIINADEDELKNIEGFGEVIAHNIHSYFNNEKNLELFNKAIEIITFTASETVSDKLRGINFVITGDVTKFKNRNELKSFIENLGGKVTGSVTSKTNYLINNDNTSESSKNKKAKELNIPVITEEDFLKLTE